MIKNERQAKIARSKIASLMKERDSLVDETSRQSYGRMITAIQAEVEEYERVRSGQIRAFNVGSLDEIGEAVVMARIATGMTHRELASLVGVSEQMVQKDESREYESAGIARVAEILDALGYEFVGCVRPAQSRFSLLSELRVVEPKSGHSASAAVPATLSIFPATVAQAEPGEVGSSAHTQDTVWVLAGGPA